MPFMKHLSMVSFPTGRIKREELFVVTKLPVWALQEDNVEFELRKSLKLLNLDYVDLYLVHTPIGAKHNGQHFLKMENGKVRLWPL